MSKFAFVGDQQQATSFKVQRAFDAGRLASVAAANISTNPHTSNTPEWVAWRNGHVTYASNGANTVQDTSCVPAKFANPAVTIVTDSADTSGATKKATPAAPGLPFRIDWGDGSWSDNPAASTTAITHTYAEGGVYATRLLFAGAQWDAEDVTVTIAAIELQATVNLDAATETLVVTYTENGVGIESEELTLESSDAEVFTVDATVETNVDGDATITLTRVGDGEATLTVTVSSLSAVADVTSSGLGVIDVASGVALNAATVDVVATFTMDGDPVEDEELTLTSADTGVFTVDATATTDVDGEATITLTRIADGESTLAIESTTGQIGLCLVTATGLGEIDLVATKALDAATADVVATFTMDGDPVNDEELTLTSSDTDMFTVDATATTDESGEATITLTRVGNGVANLTVEASTGKTDVCVVTVSGVE